MRKALINTSVVALIFIILAALTAPLAISLPIIHGKYIVIEKLTVLDEHGHVKYVKPLYRYVTTTPTCCQCCVQSSLSDSSSRLGSTTGIGQIRSWKPTVLHYSYKILMNKTVNRNGVKEKITVLDLKGLIKTPLKPCVYRVLMDVAVYHREDGIAKTSILLLNFKTPSGKYVASIMYVKVYPKTKIPLPRGEVVVVEKPTSMLNALNAVGVHVGKHSLSTIKSLGLDKPIHEAIKNLIRELHLKPETSKLLNGKTKFLIAVLMDPDECQTDQDCWEKYGYGYDYCYCSSTCVQWNWPNLIGCALTIPGCGIACGAACASGATPACIGCILMCAGGLISMCGNACEKWEKRCDCGYIIAP